MSLLKRGNEDTDRQGSHVQTQVEEAIASRGERPLEKVRLLMPDPEPTPSFQEGRKRIPIAESPRE